MQELQQQVSELTSLLALEQKASAELRLGSAQLSDQLKSAQAERDQLTTRVAALAAKAQEAAARADEATGKLRDASATVAADKDKIELQLRQIESLQRDIAALQKVRTDLEAKVASLSPAQPNSGAVRDRTKELEARLATEQEKTALAQKEIDARDIRLADLGSRAERPTRRSPRSRR